ncbi:MAG: type II secretion system protein GspG [Nitrospirae bacterium]|nr:type II secretion system protein GspG [Nitrospirota bacterium]
MKKKTKKKWNEGFTLIEIIVVAGIIAILAGILVPMIMREINESRITRATADLRSIATAMIVFNKDTGRWPVMDATCNQTVTLLTGNGAAPANIDVNGWDNTTTSMLDNHFSTNDDSCYAPWNGPYMPIVSADPWGRQYVINAANLNIAGGPVWVVSAGPDGIVDTNPVNTITGGDDIGMRIK